MKITGITIARNVVTNDYPVLESIRSILPLVDEMIVSIGLSQDHTEDLIRSIHDSKIKIIHSVWDDSLKAGGQVLAIETNKVISQVSADTDWIFYIQADEVIHEKDHALILSQARLALPDKKIQGLLFDYFHFYGSYEYIADSRKWYRREIRVIRNDRNIQSFRDAQGFRAHGKKLFVRKLAVPVYHYGWVKNPSKMKAKLLESSRYWQADHQDRYVQQAKIFNDFEEYDSLKLFEGSHPQVMQDRIKNQDWHPLLDIHRKKLSIKNFILYYFEKWTGRRLFEFRNYRIQKIEDRR